MFIFHAPYHSLVSRPNEPFHSFLIRSRLEFKQPPWHGIDRVHHESHAEKNDNLIIFLLPWMCWGGMADARCN